MGEVVRAVVLGVVQGLTEFVPVSSSGHLVLVPYLAGWDPPSLAFNVAMHFGTLGAVVVYFRRELVTTARGLLGLDRSPDGLLYRRLGVYLAVASVPVAVVGLLAAEPLEAVFETPVAASGFLLLTAALLLTGERVRSRRVRRAPPATPAPDAVAEDRAIWEGDWRGERTRVDAPPPRLPTGEDAADPSGASLRQLGLAQAVGVGVLQSLALLPGVSRSGATITAGLVGGLTREAATRFSFLLSLPALVGAGILSLGDLGAQGAYSGTAISAGVLASFVSGYLAIRLLVALVARRDLRLFAWYCVGASLVGFTGAAAIG